MSFTFEFSDKEETVLIKGIGEGHAEIPDTVLIINDNDQVLKMDYLCSKEVLADRNIK